MSFKKDYRQGIKNEINIFNKLKEIDNSIKKTTNKLCIIDFYSNNYLYELKTRNNKLNTFPTTIVGHNKIKYANKLNKSLIIVFSFTDGDYYYKHSTDNLQNSKMIINKFVRNSRSDFKDKVADYVYIPVKELKPLHLLENEFYSPTSTI